MGTREVIPPPKRHNRQGRILALQGEEEVKVQVDDSDRIVSMGSGGVPSFTATFNTPPITVPPFTKQLVVPTKLMQRAHVVHTIAKAAVETDNWKTAKWSAQTAASMSNGSSIRINGQEQRNPKVTVKVKKKSLIVASGTIRKTVRF